MPANHIAGLYGEGVLEREHRVALNRTKILSLSYLKGRAPRAQNKIDALMHLRALTLPTHLNQEMTCPKYLTRQAYDCTLETKVIYIFLA